MSARADERIVREGKSEQRRGAARLAVLLLLAVTLAAETVVAEPQTISQEQALAIAQGDTPFLGTWVRVAKGDIATADHTWHVSAFSKSANPPVLFVIDDASGRILYKSLNSDHPISLTGVATNGEKTPEMDTGHAYFATIVTDDGLVIYVDRRRPWAKDLVGKRVAVTGALRSRNTLASFETQPSRAALVFERARWRRAP